MAKLHSLSIFVVVASLWRVVSSLRPQHITTDQPISSSCALGRRSFVFSTLGCSTFLPHCGANAYERRDVGGSNRSPETAAMNEMAYQTNNRLERAGFKLDTAQEQAASLSSALSGYSYEPSSTEKGKKSSTEGGRKPSNKRK